MTESCTRGEQPRDAPATPQPGNLPEDLPHLVLDDLAFSQKAAALRTANPQNSDRSKPLCPQNPVCLVYTSESAGIPERVVIPGHAITHLAIRQKEGIPRAKGMRVAQLGVLGSEASAQELFIALSSGKTLVVPTNRIRHDPIQLMRWLDQKKVNDLSAPALVIEMLSEAAIRQGNGLETLLHIDQVVSRWPRVRNGLLGWRETARGCKATSDQPGFNWRLSTHSQIIFPNGR